MLETTLKKDCEATRIPSGEPVVLAKGESFAVTQTLGGSATLRDSSGLYRVSSDCFDALGDEVNAQILANQASIDPDSEFSEAQIWDALRLCFDPEIPVNIVDLGLIYDLSYEALESGKYTVFVKMTLTATGCGMGPTIAADAQSKIEQLPKVERAEVEIVWDPQWTPHMISDEGRKILGLD